MKNKIENFTPMGTTQLMETNGGGFAYDVGRVLRFISLMGPNAAITAMAISEWQVNATINNL
jgi:hypothetical protein